MKYIIFIITFILILSFIPWDKLGDSEIEEEEELAIFDTIYTPIHNLITNENSDLEETKDIDKAVRQFMREWDVKGASLAIMKDEKLIFSKGYGYADVENNIQMDVNNIFRIASISKLITAVGIMRMVEDKKISLEDKVFGTTGILKDSILYGDVYDSRVYDITVEHLLRHQAGFSNRAGDPMFNTVEIAQKMNVPPPADLETIVKYVLGNKLSFNPGSYTRYSNVGYGVLSLIIEEISGTTYENYIQLEVLKPAGCYDMHLAKNLAIDKYPNEVKYYEHRESEPIPAFDGADTLLPRSNGGNNIEALYGAGGWVASPTELLRFFSAIDGDDTYPDILNKESIEMMTKFHSDDVLPIGWTKTKEDGVWWRTGTLAGTSAILKRQKDGISWAFISNTSTHIGPYFTRRIETMMAKAFDKIKEWPDRNLFDSEYDEALNNINYLAGETDEKNDKGV